MGCSTITAEQNSALGYVSLVASSLSVLGSSATIAAFLFNSKRQQQLYQFIFFLSIADFFASLSLVVSEVLYLISQEKYTMSVCITLRAFPQYFFVCSFIWTSIIAIHLCKAAHQKPTSWKWLVAYHAFAWGLPAVLLTVLLASNNLQRAEDAFWCHPTTIFEWTFWFLPMLLSVLCNIICYSLILQNYKKKRSQRSQVIVKLGLFLLAFIFCWVWDIAEHIRLLTAPSCKLFFLWLLQDLFTPLQGFFNFIVYAVTNRMIYGSASFTGMNIHERTRLRDSIDSSASASVDDYDDY